MKYFEKDGKYNFVDDNNVLVGYSSEGNCCEQFGILLSDRDTFAYYSDDEGMIFCSPFARNYEISGNSSLLEMYNFDTTYFKEIKYSQLDDLDDKAEREIAVIFKLLCKVDYFPTLYLTLYNHQNGYYSHGFNMDVGGTTIRTGEI